jgi:putative membrane protein
MNREARGDAEQDVDTRAREHLANERTYLAWLRTGISVAALGVAIAKFAPERGARTVASGLIMIFIGLLVSAYGTMRYRTVRRQLDAGVFDPASFGAIAVTTLAIVVSLIASLILI